MSWTPFLHYENGSKSLYDILGPIPTYTEGPSDLKRNVIALLLCSTTTSQKFFGPKLQRSVAFAKWKILFRYDDSIQSL